jgi:hypothetical protein
MSVSWSLFCNDRVTIFTKRAEAIANLVESSIQRMVKVKLLLVNLFNDVFTLVCIKVSQKFGWKDGFNF